MQAFVTPHCSGCFRDLTETAGPLQVQCGHLFCAECLAAPQFACPVDGTTCELASVLPRPDISQRLSEQFANTDLESVLETVFAGVNTRGVLCKFVHRGVPCPDSVHCKYLHGFLRLLSDSTTLECQKCLLRLAPGTEVCPFCKTSGVRGDLGTQAEMVSPSFNQSEAESLTASSDIMQSLDPVFPSMCQKEEAKDSPKEFNVLQSYVDLAMSDSSSEEEEVVVIPSATKSALLQLLRALWHFFHESAVALLARLSKKPDSTMVFYG